MAQAEPVTRFDRSYDGPVMRRAFVATMIAAVFALSGCGSVAQPSSPPGSPSTQASNTPSSGSTASHVVSQQHFCGRLASGTCDDVISFVQETVPGTRSSAVAVADYAAIAPIGSTRTSQDSTSYLVSFAPYGDQDLWMNPPTWLVTDSNGTWSLKPESDVTSLNVCFVMLLRDAGLTDYAPSFPSGECS